MATTMTLKRIQREISDLQKEDLGSTGMSLAPSSDDSLFKWSASLPGPEGSPYEGGVFKLDFELAPDYPFSAPKVNFVTRIYHMNISDRGAVCLDVLKHNWSPALSLYKVLLSLSSLLTDPNPKDPLVPSIATSYTRNRKQHDATAREWTRLYALPPTASSSPSSNASATAMPSSSNNTATTVSSSSASSVNTRGRARPQPRRQSASTTTQSSAQQSRRQSGGNDGAVITIPSDSESDSGMHSSDFDFESHDESVGGARSRARAAANRSTNRVAGKRKRPSAASGGPGASGSGTATASSSSSGTVHDLSDDEVTLAGAVTVSTGRERKRMRASAEGVRIVGDVIVIDD
ncbi:hypothetical protein BD410DRAFT_899608 [Rickenella mellea]|uniref:E2 ubiquitin-conjugating enzyme n=1 Tax=Rickenella mellea TaxID=50990 RepID=A0A4Y7PXV6_9AGAM|nr:hypothetical protein BD410DRAFT_899608 [Rickenella mellea]